MPKLLRIINIVVANETRDVTKRTGTDHQGIGRNHKRPRIKLDFIQMYIDLGTYRWYDDTRISLISAYTRLCQCFHLGPIPVTIRTGREDVNVGRPVTVGLTNVPGHIGKDLLINPSIGM